MGQQYFEQQPSSQHNIQTIHTKIKDIPMSFQTDSGVFSKQRVDFGSALLINTFIEHAQINGSEKLLELGSGYGPIALSLAKYYPQITVEGVEVNERALNLAQINAKLNQVTNVRWIQGDATQYHGESDYHYILTNPPIRAGKAIIQQFVRQAHLLLQATGQLWVVIQKKQGAPSMEKFMLEQFGNATLIVRDKGYWILMSEK